MKRRAPIAALLLLGVLAKAHPSDSPLESDFSEGYWDRDFSAHSRQMMAYNVAIAAEDPMRVRQQSEEILKKAGGKLISFSDQTAANAMGPEGPNAISVRPVYMINYHLLEGRAPGVAKDLTALGRLTAFNVNAPYVTAQTNEIQERIDWIEKEKSQNADVLKKMPVSRAMLDSKIKRLRQALESARTGKGTAAVSVQILRDAAASERTAPLSLP